MLFSLEFEDRVMACAWFIYSGFLHRFPPDPGQTDTLRGEYRGVALVGGQFWQQRPERSLFGPNRLMEICCAKVTSAPIPRLLQFRQVLTLGDPERTHSFHEHSSGTGDEHQALLRIIACPFAESTWSIINMLSAPK